MSLTRRAALGAAVAALSGCAASPVVTGTPRPAPSPTPPVQAPEAAEAAASVAELAAVLGSLIDSPVWPEQPWAVAAKAQTDDHLGRLVALDPLGAEPRESFDVTVPTPAAYTDLAAAETALASSIDGTLPPLEAAAAAAPDPELRLLYASVAAATVGLRSRAQAPVAGEAQPRPLQDTTLEASLPVVLGHVWALIYGLGVGLGRLDRDDPLIGAGSERLDEARVLRNDLRELLPATAEPGQPAAFALPTAMDTAESIRAGWAELELRLLEAFGRLVAADPAPQWRETFLLQVPAAQHFGAALEYWPGWVA